MIERLKLLVYAGFAYLNLSAEHFGILMVLMCIDSALGVITALRLKEHVSFKKLLWGITLKLCFLVIPLTVALLGKGLGYDFHTAISIVMAILMVAEAYSILGNVYSIKNRKREARIDVVSQLLKSLRSILKNTIDKLLENIEENLKK